MELGWLTYSFRHSVHHHHDKEHGGWQADVLKLRVLQLVGNGETK